MHLCQLTIYPVKSCAGVSLDNCGLDAFGLRGDRRWMVVDSDKQFVTQRQLPALALIQVAPLAAGLRLWQEDSAVEVGLPGNDVGTIPVDIWGSSTRALDAGDEASAWLSERSGKALRLVYMPEQADRTTFLGAGSRAVPLSFADSSPLLLVSQASLDELNSRLPSPVPMNRFRPNLVIDGCEAFAEDQWQKIRIGNTEFDLAEACERCAIPSIIQETAERDKTINRVLASFRRRDRKIYFGQHLVYAAPGELAIGDAVEIIA